jgi:hypothetical protein
MRLVVFFGMWMSLALGSIACGPSIDPPIAGPFDGGPRDADAPGWETLPPNVWSFVPVPGAVCGNGSPYSVGVNPRPGAREVLFIVMGGGACWDADTCFTRGAATHVAENYTRATFDGERALVSMVGWDDRATATNPFREAHLVFVPYCTGDLHAGDSVRTYAGAPGGARIHHRGAVATQAYVDEARAAWPELAEVRVIGFSAGGFGAQLNWNRYADAWPGADLALLADSAPLLQPPAALYATWRSNWAMQTPRDCTECATTLAAYDDYFDARYPDSRLGLLATTRDSVLSTFWQTPDPAPLLTTLVDDHLADNPTTRYFIVDSDAHVIFGAAFVLRAADGTLLLDWLAGWLENDARFRSVRP